MNASGKEFSRPRRTPIRMCAPRQDAERRILAGTTRPRGRALSFDAMRRWNGWGESAVTADPPPAVRALLEGALGPGSPPRDVAFEDVCARVPASRLQGAALVDTSAAARVLHARGQSLPDLVALRSG